MFVVLEADVATVYIGLFLISLQLQLVCHIRILASQVLHAL